MNASDSPPGLGDSLRRLAASVLGGLQSRLALAGLELEEARERLIGTLLLAFGAVLAAGVTLLAASVWVVLLFWDRTGPAIVGGLALGYALLCAFLAWRLVARLRRAPALLGDTLAELRRDADALRAGNPP